jgi:hypothetical protein
VLLHFAKIKDWSRLNICVPYDEKNVAGEGDIDSTEFRFVEDASRYDNCGATKPQDRL